MNTLKQGLPLVLAAITSACAPIKDPNKVANDAAIIEGLNIDWEKERQENDGTFPKTLSHVVQNTRKNVAEKTSLGEAFLEAEKKAIAGCLKDGHRIFLKTISERNLSPAALYGLSLDNRVVIGRIKKTIITSISYDEKSQQIISKINPQSSQLSSGERTEINKIMTQQDEATNKIVRKVQAGEMAESDL